MTPTFPQKWLPWLLLAPQLSISALFFYSPMSEAILLAFQRQDPFGLAAQFVGLDNFTALLVDPGYRASVFTTLFFSVAVTILALVPGLGLALVADRGLKGMKVYRGFLMLPYAIAPSIAGIVWLFLFNPGIGIIGIWLRRFGFDWNPLLNGDQALALVVMAAAWKQVGYNFLFFLAGLQSIPLSLIEAARLDGAGPWRRFWTVILPLLSPVGFFLLITDLTYAFFETFGIIHAVTSGGPARATQILVYKIYDDGVVGLDLGSSSAQSVLLLLIVVTLTALQFRYVEKRVHYA